MVWLKASVSMVWLKASVSMVWLKASVSTKLSQQVQVLFMRPKYTYIMIP
jgi:hypothetical protein